MKSLAKTFVVIYCVLLISGISGCKKNSNTNTDKPNDTTKSENTTFETVDSEKTITLQEYKVPKELKYSNHTPEFLYDKFFPIGWSKDGKFAYVIEPADEAAGLYFFEIIIQNIISDKIEWQWKPLENEKGSVTQMWTDNYKLFQKKLNDYGIIQNEFKLEKPNFKHNDVDYNVILESETAVNEDYGFDVMIGAKIFLKSKQLGSKQVYDYKEKDYSLTLAQIIAGVLISPHEDRIVVILKKERSGYEGPPNVIFYTITGGNLTESFKK